MSSAHKGFQRLNHGSLGVDWEEQRSYHIQLELPAEEGERRVCSWFRTALPEGQQVPHSGAQGSGQKSKQELSAGVNSCVVAAAVVKQEAETWSLAATPPTNSEHASP